MSIDDCLYDGQSHSSALHAVALILAAIKLVIPGQDCKKQLGMKVHPVFTPPVNFGAAHLSSEAKNIHYCQPLYTDAGEALPYIVQILLPNDGIDPFHLGLLADADLHAALGAVLHQWPIAKNPAPDFPLLKPDKPSVDLVSCGGLSAICVLLCKQAHNRDPRSCAKYLVCPVESNRNFFWDVLAILLCSLHPSAFIINTSNLVHKKVIRKF
jgi:hypothetical protein